MSSIDNILSILRKTLEEKKQPLNEQYEITSTWLAKELDIVRKLVQNDPRDMQVIEEKMVPESVSSASSSANNSKKRKSPETASEFKLSPEQKRSSVDVKDLLTAAGLPADLNKLKKEQLLEELVKRGVTKYNMKNLKNDLIDALESAIMLEKRNSFKVGQEEATTSYENTSPVNQQPFVATVASVDEVEAPPAPTSAEPAAPPSAAKPRVRQGSLMAEFRKKVYNTSSQDAEVDAKAKIENEFRNRQERHRDSIARKSQILEAPPAEAEVHEDTEETIQSSSVPFAAAAVEPELHEAETAMDIASPIRETVRPVEPEEIEQPEEAAEETNCEVADEAVESMDAAPETAAIEESQREAEPDADKEEDEISDIEEDASVSASVVADIMQETSASALSQQSESSAFQQSSKSSLSSTNSGQSHTSEPVKKPVNLINLSNSASSFLDKPANKPIVPALAKAKLLKEQEELKEQKRKELKAAKAAGAMGGSKPAATSAAAASESNTVRSPWGKMAKGIKNVAEDVKSKINLFNKKPAAATESVAAKAPTKQPFDVRATESKSSLSSAPPATPASAAAPVPAVVAPAVVVAAPVEVPVVAAVAPPAPPAVEAAQSTPAHALPPKSAIKEILKNYHDAVASPISAKPAPVISVASVASPVAPAASIPMPIVSAPVSSAPVPEPTPVAPVAAPVVTPLQPAEPHVLREKVMSSAPTTVAAPVPAAPVAAQPAAQEEEEDDYDPANNYQIEDTPDSDDSDGGSGTDDEDESNKKKQQIPEWARGDALREALERQYGLNGHTPMDPDLIFPEVQSCSLEEIFGRKEGLSRKYSARTSSAHWDADELTLVEKRQYRVHMGYEQNPAAHGHGASAGVRPVKLH